MARIGTERAGERCALCGKGRDQVKKLLVGVYGGICLDCIELCNDIIKGESNQDDNPLSRDSGIPKHKDISRILNQWHAIAANDR